MKLTISNAEMKQNWDIYPPANLFDGNIYNFAHSYPDEDGMWMRVHLENRSKVSKIIVNNRQECCRDRIVGASIFIKLGDKYIKECGKIYTEELLYTFDCMGEGDVVELSQKGTVDQWNIAEIQVFGKPVESEDAGIALIIAKKHHFFKFDVHKCIFMMHVSDRKNSNGPT